MEQTEIIKVLNNYNLSKILNIKKISLGLANENWVVKTKDKQFILRKIAFWRTPIENQFEFELLSYLKEHNFPYKIPFPIENKKKELITLFKENRFWLYEYLEGDIKKSLKANIKEIATLISHINSITKNIKLKVEKDYNDPYGINFIEWCIKDFKNSNINKRLKVNQIYEKYIFDIEDFVNFVKKNNLSKIHLEVSRHITHNDIKFDNILFNKENEVSGILDFDNISYNSKVNDLALFFIFELRTKSNQLDFKLVEEFLIHYLKLQTISKQELKILIICMLSFAIKIVICYYNAILDKNNNIKLQDMINYYEFHIWCKTNRKLVQSRINEIIIKN